MLPINKRVLGSLRIVFTVLLWVLNKEESKELLQFPGINAHGYPYYSFVCGIVSYVRLYPAGY
jgi:hypothetical protein